MMEILRPMYERIEAGHTTMKEESFNQASFLLLKCKKTMNKKLFVVLQTYYRELRDAFEHCCVYERTGDQRQVRQAWDILYRVSVCHK